MSEEPDRIDLLESEIDDLKRVQADLILSIEKQRLDIKSLVWALHQIESIARDVSSRLEV